MSESFLEAASAEGVFAEFGEQGQQRHIAFAAAVVAVVMAAEADYGWR